MANKKIQQYIAEWMDGFGPENGYELSRCEFVKEAGNWYLRVFVDKKVNGEYSYMSSDDCAVVSEFLSAKLDDADPIKQNYYLEVSSPGLDRLLVNDRDFERFNGELIEIGLYEPIGGSKHITGKLRGFSDGVLTVETDKETMQIPLERTSKVNLAVII